MDGIFKTTNFDELDFLQLNEDDINLSQNCNAAAGMQSVNFEMLRDFDLDGGRHSSCTTYRFETNSDESKRSRLGGMLIPKKKS